MRLLLVILAAACSEKVRKAISGFVFFAGTLSILMSSSVHAQAHREKPTIPSSLALEDALRIFRASGLGLLLADNDIQQARAGLRQAGIVSNPLLTGMYARSFDYNASLCEGCSANGVSVTLSDQAALVDVVSGQRGLRVHVAKALVRAAQSSRADAERILITEVKQRYMAVVSAQSALKFARDTLESFGQILRLTQERYTAGAISEAEVAKVETAKLAAEQDVDRAQRDVAVTKSDLVFLLGVRGTLPPFEVLSELPRYQVPPSLANASEEDLVQTAIEHRADLRLAQELLSSAKESVVLAKRGRVPDVAVIAQFQRQGTGVQAIQPPTLTVGLAVPLPVFDRNQGAIAKAQVDERRRSLEQVQAEIRVKTEVSQAWATLGSSRRRVERMEQRLLERARMSRDLVRVQYEKGAASLLEFLDAQRTFVSTQLGYLRDLSEYWSSLFELERALGAEFSR